MGKVSNKIRTVNCIICNKEFKTNNSIKNTCSIRCSHENANLQKIYNSLDYMNPEKVYEEKGDDINIIRCWNKRHIYYEQHKLQHTKEFRLFLNAYDTFASLVKSGTD